MRFWRCPTWLPASRCSAAPSSEFDQRAQAIAQRQQCRQAPGHPPDDWPPPPYAAFGNSTGELLFWWPVIQPWPSRAHWPRCTMIPYLLFADIQNTALSAFLIFSERVLYPTYAAVPRLWGISALDDRRRQEQSCGCPAR